MADNQTNIARILGPDGAPYAADCLADADKFGIKAEVLAEAAIRNAKDEEFQNQLKAKAKDYPALNPIQLLLFATAEKIAEERQAVEIMGGPQLDKTSPIAVPAFKQPEFIQTAPLALTGANPFYDLCARYIGKKYVWGGKNLESAGVDCSGYVRGILDKFCGKEISSKLGFSSQVLADDVAKAAHTRAQHSACNIINANDIPENAVMTMGPKPAPSGIGHVVFVTRNDKGERVVMQSMGHVGVCEMPLDKFVNYLRRQPANRSLTVADAGPLLSPNLNAGIKTAPVKADDIATRGHQVKPLNAAPVGGRIANPAEHPVNIAAAKPAPHHTPQPAPQPTLGG